MKLLVTGGCGFIGTNFILDWLSANKGLVVNLDKLTYAGNINNLESISSNPNYHFVHGDILDRDLVKSLLLTHQPSSIVHFAAETHVDRSIHDPEAFIQTNVVGTQHLLEEARIYWEQLPESSKKSFRFIHVSTDEVYGSLAPNEPPSTETSLYAPNSPYAASKASSDHFARAYFHTYGLPVIITHCSNNFGPWQFPEKLIPLIMLHAKQGISLPIYGDGQQIRNWLYVTDHCEALRIINAKGIPGEVYNIGSRSEMTNLELVELLCGILDKLLPNSTHVPHASLITFVKDRPGHDRRYDLDSTKIYHELGWSPPTNLQERLESTVRWYLESTAWIEEIASGEYREWIEKHYKK